MHLIAAPTACASGDIGSILALSSGLDGGVSEELGRDIGGVLGRLAVVAGGEDGAPGIAGLDHQGREWSARTLARVIDAIRERG
jgi:hypothetical protein